MADWVNEAVARRLNPEAANIKGPATPYTPPPYSKTQNSPKTGKKTTTKTSSKKSSSSKSSSKKSSKPQSDLDKWLAGDDTYQQQLAGFNKEKSDYDARYNTEKGRVNRDYDITKRDMNDQAVDDRDQQANDFAGRGILHSGVYAKALGDYNADFNTQMNNLLTGKTDSLGDLSSDRTDFLRQLDLDKQAAKQDAIKRRAQQLGI